MIPAEREMREASSITFPTSITFSSCGRWSQWTPFLIPT